MNFTTGTAANLTDVTAEILSVSAPCQSALLCCPITTTDSGPENTYPSHMYDNSSGLVSPANMGTAALNVVVPLADHIF